MTPTALRAFSERRICEPRAISPADMPTTSHIDAVATERVQPKPGSSHGGTPHIEVTMMISATGAVMAPTTSRKVSARWASAAVRRAATHRARSRGATFSSQPASSA